MKTKHFHWAYLDRVDYGDALAAQHALRDAVLAGAGPGGLILLEHPPTITLGRHGDKKNVLASPEILAREGLSVHRIERGGDVTYHGPGQLVGYPVMAVTGGVRRFVTSLADAARQLLAELGIDATWREDRPGLWTEAGKIAAVGLHIRRGVAMHGFALNVDPDLSHYQHIVPCGIATAGVTSIRALLGSAPGLDDVATRFASLFTPPGPSREPSRLTPLELFRQHGLTPPGATPPSDPQSYSRM